MNKQWPPSGDEFYFYTPYITRNGKRVYPKNAKVFRIPRRKK
jgi:hypothetical protein